MQHAASLAKIEEHARRTISAMPALFRQLAEDVALRVTDWPDREMLNMLGISDPIELTGLYEGTPVTEKSFFAQPTLPDTVWLFREPILAEWRSRGTVSLETLVAHVTVHEFAHHFGWSDDDIASVDRWWE